MKLLAVCKTPPLLSVWQAQEAPEVKNEKKSIFVWPERCFELISQWMTGDRLHRRQDFSRRWSGRVLVDILYFANKNFLSWKAMSRDTALWSAVRSHYLILNPCRVKISVSNQIWRGGCIENGWFNCKVLRDESGCMHNVLSFAYKRVDKTKIKGEYCFKIVLIVGGFSCQSIFVCSIQDPPCRAPLQEAWISIASDFFQATHGTNPFQLIFELQECSELMHQKLLLCESSVLAFIIWSDPSANKKGSFETFLLLK